MITSFIKCSNCSVLKVYLTAKFDQNLDTCYNNPFAILEKDYDTWIQNNPYKEILERALEIIETELARISSEQLHLDTLLEERLGNIRFLVNYTSLLPP